MAGLVGVDAARGELDEAVGGFSGRGTVMLIVSGPPGSGKSTLIEDALARQGYIVHGSAPGETTARECAQAKRFCETANCVNAMLSGEGSKRRAVVLADPKSAVPVYDALKAMRASALVVVEMPGSAKALAARRRAAAVIRVPYPPASAVVDHLRATLGDEADADVYARCALASGGSVQKAYQLAMGETLGTRAREATKGEDTSIFQDVARALRYCAERRPFGDIAAAVSSEPSMSAMIIRESVPRPSAATREAYRALSKTPPGSRWGAIASAATFCETALREEATLRGQPLRFPRCYTTTSSRTVNIKKRAADGGQDGYRCRRSS